MKTFLLLLITLLLVSCVPSRNIVNTQNKPEPIIGDKIENLHVAFDLTPQKIGEALNKKFFETDLNIKRGYRTIVDLKFKLDEGIEYFQVLQKHEKLGKTREAKYLGPILQAGSSRFESQMAIIDDQSLAVIYANVNYTKRYLLIPGNSYLLRVSTKVAASSFYDLNLISWAGAEGEVPLVANLCESDLATSLVSIPRKLTPIFFLPNGVYFLNSDKKTLCGRTITGEKFEEKCTYPQTATSNSLVPPSVDCTYSTSVGNFEVNVKYSADDTHDYSGEIVCKENGSNFQEVKFTGCHEKIYNKIIFYPAK